MLSRGDAVVYKCRGLYKVEDIGTLDFPSVDSKKQYILFNLLRMKETGHMSPQMTVRISGSR